MTILKKASPPVRERFVVSGDHWICGEILIDEGTTKILIIDSLGMDDSRSGIYPSTKNIIGIEE